MTQACKPDDWETVRLADVSQIVTGSTPPTDNLSLYGNEHLFVSPADIGERKYVAVSGKMLSTLGWARSKQLPKDSILFVCIGSTIGKVAILDQEGATNQQINAVIGSSGINQEFLYYSLARKAPEIRANASEQAVPIINKSTFSDVLLAVPTVAEQEAIAEALSDADGAVEGLERLIAKKRLIKQGAMQDLLTARRRLPGFSGEWADVCLGEVLTVRHGRSQKDVESPHGSYPILATGGQIGRSTAFLWEKPSVLIGRKGTIDRPQFVETPFWTVDTLFYTDIQSPNVPRFLFYVFQQIDWTSYNEASGVPSLNAGTIEAIEVYLPDPAEQKAIALALADMDAEIAALEARLDKARRIKEGMMHNLLTGRVRLV